MLTESSTKSQKQSPLFCSFLPPFPVSFLLPTSRRLSYYRVSHFTIPLQLVTPFSLCSLYPALVLSPPRYILLFSSLLASIPWYTSQHLYSSPPLSSSLFFSLPLSSSLFIYSSHSSDSLMLFCGRCDSGGDGKQSNSTQHSATEHTRHIDTDIVIDNRHRQR